MPMTKPWASWTDKEVREYVGTQAQGASGKWHAARPLPYPGIRTALRHAWDVLIGKADALYWEIDFDRKDGER